MDSRYFVINDSADLYKNITFNVVDYVNNYLYSNGADEQAPLDEPEPKYVFGPHNRNTPFFLATTDCLYDGDAAGLYLFEANSAENVVASHDQKIKDGAYRRLVTDVEMSDCMDNYGNFFFLIDGQPSDYDYEKNVGDSLLRHFKICYMKNGYFYDKDTGKAIKNEDVLVLMSGIKMGKMPVYVITLNTQFLGFHAFWSLFHFPRINAVVNLVMKSAFPLKQELFDTVITSQNYKKTGKYMIHTPEDNFEFEMFGINTNSRNIKPFKNANIHDFNNKINVDTNVPYTFNGLGVVNLDLSSLQPGEMAYVRATIDAGDFFNHHVFRQQRMYFEYAITKTQDDVFTDDITINV